MQFRAEKVKVWKAISTIHPATRFADSIGPGTVDGKSVPGYRQEDRVHPRSQTETYAALRLEIENWRWAGIPLLHPRGQAIAEACYRDHDPVQAAADASVQRRRVSRLERDQAEPDLDAHSAGRGHLATIRSEAAWPSMDISPVQMNFSYADAFGKSSRTATSAFCWTPCWATAPCSPTATGFEATWP